MNRPTSRLWPRQGQVARVTYVHSKICILRFIGFVLYITYTCSQCMYVCECVCVCYTHTHRQMRVHTACHSLHPCTPSSVYVYTGASASARVHTHRAVSTAKRRDSPFAFSLSLRRPSSPVPGTATDPSIRKFAVRLSRGRFVRAGRTRCARNARDRVSCCRIVRVEARCTTGHMTEVTVAWPERYGPRYARNQL